MEWFWAALFFVSSLFNLRASFKLLVDWKGMLTTCRFVENATPVDDLPDEAPEQAPDAPSSSSWCRRTRARRHAHRTRLLASLPAGSTSWWW
jgi:hypothetical protein